MSFGLLLAWTSICTSAFAFQLAIHGSACLGSLAAESCSSALRYASTFVVAPANRCDSVVSDYPCCARNGGGGGGGGGAGKPFTCLVAESDICIPVWYMKRPVTL